MLSLIVLTVSTLSWLFCICRLYVLAVQDRWDRLISLKVTVLPIIITASHWVRSAGRHNNPGKLVWIRLPRTKVFCMLSLIRIMDGSEFIRCMHCTSHSLWMSGYCFYLFVRQKQLKALQIYQWKWEENQDMFVPICWSSGYPCGTISSRPTKFTRLITSLIIHGGVVLWEIFQCCHMFCVAPWRLHWS